MSYKNEFEIFLREKHAKDFVGTDDGMVDAFEEWVQDLDVDTLIKYADIFAIQRYQLGYVHASNEALRTIRRHS